MTVTATFELDFRTKRFQDAAKGLRALGTVVGSDAEALGPMVSRELRLFLDSVAEALAQRHGNPYPGGTTATTLSRRSGTLAESIRNSVFVQGKTLDDVVGGIGGVFYLKVHEYGAVIRAKKSKYLTIPLPAALNPNGTPKKKSAREWANTFVIKSRAGNLLIVQRVGKDIVPLYLLKTEVTIPARAQVRATVEAGIPYFVDTLADRLAKALVAGNAGAAGGKT